MKNELKIKKGDLKADNPIIGIIGKGANTYIWIGNNSDTNKACYATLSGVKTLEKLACGILTTLGHNAPSVKKTIKNKSKKK